MPNFYRFTSALTPLRWGVFACVYLLLLPESALAQITEPNGTVVPGEPESDSEIPLWTFFENEGETIDAIATASIEPGTFSPRCDFEATLVLSESQAEAGLSWYNVPADPNIAPDALYELLAPTTQTGTVINSADIITSPDYAGGLIGFALTKYTNGSGNETYPIYYSEYQRNVLCTACTTPDHWKMMLVYGSTVFPNTFYLAFEDWEGANQETWFGNDGDFNDKVFRVTGVTCLGGGEPCDTGKLGHCAAGLTECQPGGVLGCRQQIAETAEVCDNIDNDCDGLIDNEAPCPPGLVCREGTCEPPCSGAEFPCPGTLQCTPEGLCVDPACIEVTCDAGEVCRGGDCVGACDDVTCPLGQTCQLGRCVDPCADISCEGTTVCDRGVCVEPCSCRPCSADLSCAASGECVEPGCESTTCDAGSVCQGGTCVDACTHAVCPGGATCALGQCAEPEGHGGATSSAATSGAAISAGGTFTLPPTSASGATTVGNSNVATGAGGTDGIGEDARGSGDAGGCSCSLIDHTHHPLALSSLLAVFGVGWWRRRRDSVRR